MATDVRDPKQAPDSAPLPKAVPVGQIPPAEPAPARELDPGPPAGSSGPGTGEPGLPARMALGAVRGAVASMAMTGMREFTRRVGLLEEPPPEAIVRQRLLRRPFRRAKHGRRRAGVELIHWGYGAAGGAVFAALPAEARRAPWAGPLYGLAVWGGFELALAPALDLSQAKRVRARDRLALALDHLLYGFVVGGLDRR